ncbi:MAG: peptide-methionine (R)-S-oxide reductase [Pseudomonadota bacterium]|jgi:peptide-methionine (R)-S-oxide reductase
MIDRRQLLIKAAGSALLINAAAQSSAFAASTSSERFEVTLSDAEWRKRLTPEQYAVLRDQSTERAGTSPLDREKRKGVFVCAGCNLDLYRSEDKFDSGTGWPSFVRPIKNAVRTSIDRSLFSVRIEVHCRRCGGHLGHVFDDGPAPTGKRYCMNGIAMKFRPV